jgi:coenzyme F420-reducing hydrogenase delta subunit
MLQMYNLSSGEGTKFAEFAIEMTEKIKEMGPNPLKKAREKMAA